MNVTNSAAGRARPLILAGMLAATAVGCQSGVPVSTSTPVAPPTPTAAAPATARPSPTATAVVPTETATPRATATAPAGAGTPGAPAATPFPIAASIAGGSNFPIVHAGSVWSPQWELGTVIRVDPETNEVLATIPVGREPHAIAAHGTGVYVSALQEDGAAILRIDPQANEVVGRIAVATTGWAMAVTGDTLFMTAPVSGAVVRVDLERFALVEDSLFVPNPLGVAVDGDDAYVGTGGSGLLTHYDNATGERSMIQTETRTTTIPVLTEDEIWLTTLDGAQVVVISRETHEVLDRVRMQFPFGITQHDGLMWVTDGATTETSRDERVVAIDPATREIVRVLPLAGLGLDRGIVGLDDSLWLITALGLTRLDLGN